MQQAAATIVLKENLEVCCMAMHTNGASTAPGDTARRGHERRSLCLGGGLRNMALDHRG